jgi:hypothetical protein
MPIHGFSGSFQVVAFQSPGFMIGDRGISNSLGTSRPSAQNKELTIILTNDLLSKSAFWPSDV